MLSKTLFATYELAPGRQRVSRQLPAQQNVSDFVIVDSDGDNVGAFIYQPDRDHAAPPVAIPQLLRQMLLLSTVPSFYLVPPPASLAPASILA
jgi:hypothetical protein